MKKLNDLLFNKLYILTIIKKLLIQSIELID